MVGGALFEQEDTVVVFFRASIPDEVAQMPQLHNTRGPIFHCRSQRSSEMIKLKGRCSDELPSDMFLPTSIHAKKSETFASL